MQATNQPLFRGHAARFLHLLADESGLDRNAEVRVCLRPTGLILERIVRLIEIRNEREPGIVLEFALEDPHRHVVLLATDRLFVESGVRDFEQERLLVALGAGAHHLNDGIVRMLVHLIDQRTIGANAGLALFIGRNRLEVGIHAGTAGVQLPHRIRALRLQTPPQRRRPFPHCDGIAKQNGRLILIGRCRIDLGAQLAAAEQHVVTDAGRKRRLAVALADLDIRAAKPPETERILPAEQGADDERLPRLKVERRRIGGHLAIFVTLLDLDREHVTEEADRALRGMDIEHQAALLARREVALMPLACETHERTRNDLASQDGRGIGRDLILRFEIRLRRRRGARRRVRRQRRRKFVHRIPGWPQGR